MCPECGSKDVSYPRGGSPEWEAYYDALGAWSCNDCGCWGTDDDREEEWGFSC